MSDTADKTIDELLAEAPTASALSFGEPKADVANVKTSEKKVETEDLSKTLTPAEMETVKKFEDSINIADTNGILTYGAATQNKMSQFSQATLDKVRTKDLGEVGDMLSGLVGQLKDFSTPEEQKKGIFGLFHKAQDKTESLKLKYDKVEVTVDNVSNQLEKHQMQLMKDANLMDKMYELNLQYFKELTMYIVAGKEKLEHERSTALVELQNQAAKSGLPEDAQKAKDFAAQCDRFEKKLYDLELTRTIAMQQAPQIRMIQSSDITMAEKIQSTIVNTIPLWKNQMVISLGIEHATQASKAEREVNDMTNQLLKSNADRLKTATVETAKEAERGIVDIETLKHTNEQLISAMDEIIAIQKDGKQKRQEAESELNQIENELKQKLLEASKS